MTRKHPFLFLKFLVTGYYRSSHPCVQIVGCKDVWKIGSCVEIQQYYLLHAFHCGYGAWLGLNAWRPHSLAPCQQLDEVGTVFHRSHTARITRLVNRPKVTLMIIRPVKKGMELGLRTNEGDDSMKTELVLGVLPGPKGHFWHIMFSTGILQKELCRHEHLSQYVIVFPWLHCPDCCGILFFCFLFALLSFSLGQGKVERLKNALYSLPFCVVAFFLLVRGHDVIGLTHFL